ncbi:MAG: hypothetical protein IJR90_09295 [Clostridia bacterium]|nr:hypothetical protein [Clostridia bacterium]
MNIKQLFRRLKEKARDRRGFTLGETMAATVILLLLSGAMATGVALATSQFGKSMVRSESKVLYSTLQNVVKNELANTKTVVLGSSNADGSYQVTQFFSQNYAAHDSLSHFVILPEGSEYGELALGSDTETNKLLSSSAYTYGLGASVEVGYFRTAGYFRVNLTIWSQDGDRLISEPFDVIPLNNVEIASDG